MWGRDRAFFNNYGPTEVSVCATVKRCVPDGSAPSIGRPVANARVYVLDDQRRPVPIGVIGEIYIAGAGVAAGYLGREELTAERFLPDPFGEGRMYRTGDLGTFLPDGDIVFCGRDDGQVKLRGYRIETNEVDAALREHPRVADAHSVVTNVGGRDALASYVVPRAGGFPPDGAAVLREWARRTLPDYMVPSYVIPLQSLPLGPTGKVKRDALPLPERVETASTFVAPRNADEVAVATIWQRALGRERVGRDDDFFALGGDSLLVLRVISEMGRSLGWGVAAGTFIRKPTIASICEARDSDLGAVLVSLREGHDGLAVFCFHPAGGDVTVYRGLVQEPGMRGSVTGVCSPPLVGQEPPSLLEMASLYAARIAARLDDQPFALLGWSLGGWLALEVGRLLEARGRSPALVVFWDVHLRPGAEAGGPAV